MKEAVHSSMVYILTLYLQTSTARTQTLGIAPDDVRAGGENLHRSRKNTILH